MVPFPCVCIIFGVFLTIASIAYTVKECSPNITSSHCQQSYTTRVKYHRRCGDWRRWWTCTEYKDEYRERPVCCPHYTGSYCNIAYCSHTQFNRHQHLACKINYTNDSVTHRNFYVERSSGGTCVKPNVCQCCNVGFYADHSDGYCKKSSSMPYSLCPFIPMCEFRNCHSPYVSLKGFQNECLYCQFENAPKRFQRAYKYNNLSIACEKTCSWKSDSNRCFPGFCSDEYKTSCICANGFNSTSEHCSRITKEIIITDAHVRFVDTDETTVTSPEDINCPRAVPKKWTNNVLLQKFEFSLGATYDVSGDIPMFKNYTDPLTNESLSHFVIDFAYGIITGKMKAIFVREEEPDRSLLKKEDCNSSCHERSPCPVNSMYRCESGNVSVSWLGLKHNDQIIVSVELQNGGYLVFENRDDRRIANDATKEWPTQYVPLTGIRTTEIYQFHWDTRLPYYDCSKSKCPSLPVNVPDVSKTNIVYIHWNIWSDDLSGIDYYDIEVFEMHTVGNSTDNNEIVEIMEPRIHQPGLKNLESTINVTVPGMYAVHFTAFDRAGNFMSARGLLLYDNNELIELGRGTIEVIQAKYYSEKGWITYPSSLVYVTWKDMFVKTDHFKHSWLAKVKKFESVNSTYDDINGKRTIGMVPNVKGIVKFDIAHDVYGPSNKSTSPFTFVSDVYAELALQNVAWDDGDKLIVTIRAYDLLENYRDEIVTVYKDATPPMISNLWLTKGDRINISVHSVEEFNDMVIEWDAFDYHSGISHLNWRLYDNFTGSDIIHGEIDLPGQGKTESLKECEEKYVDNMRGPACYCTHYTGCYHKHFHIEPHVAVGNETGNGIVHNRSMGVHESDYFIDLNVTNMATLTTLKTIKITVDITPPEPGHVHDGIHGFPEIDYQQDLRLDAYWEGFFDHESGVAFYQYEFATTCLNKEDFKNKNMSDDTYDTFATFTAQAPGTYFVTVVAYNRAYEMSKPVCSDGVTITTTVPSVKNVVVMNAVTEPRLIKDSEDNEWYLDRYVNRHRLTNISDVCKFSDSMTEHINLFPITPELIGEVCKGSKSYTSLVIRVLPKVHLLNITWMSGVDALLIDDYEVGFSSTTGSFEPDILSFQSSKHHTQMLINHFGVPQGKLFYIIIKSISKSNVIGIQSVGPYIMDTSPPLFIGASIQVNLSGSFLVANWSAASFIDVDDPYQLRYAYAIGHNPYSTDARQYSPIEQTGPCKSSSKYMCTAIDIAKLNWKLHANSVYYVTIKASNLAGLSVTKTSIPYRHNILFPTKGTVIDVPAKSNISANAPIKDIEDIDYTDITDRLVIRWNNFRHPHLNITYSACVGSSIGSCDSSTKRNIDHNINVYMFAGLSLSYFERYYVTLFAETLSGLVFVSSDGVTIVDPNWTLTDLKIMDGPNCNEIRPLNASHHSEDTRPQCEAEREFQISTSSLHAYFDIPENYFQYMTHAFWIIEEKFLIGDFWHTFNGMESYFIALHPELNLTSKDNILTPGRTYRLSVTFCADDVCFPSLKTSGVTIIPNKPVTGSISIDYSNHTETEDKIKITFAYMFDPDIFDDVEARSVVDNYEYTLMDESKGAYHNWLKVSNISAVNDSHAEFTVYLSGQMDFSKCRMFALRGYNKAGVWQTTFADIKQCNVYDNNQIIIPKIVVDAVGEQQLNGDGSIRDGYGKEIQIEENEKWNKVDADYTPYNNILSSTWHFLRHKDFIWAVIEVKALDTLIYYKDFNEIELSEPCSHPDVVRCGHTEEVYINVLFNDESHLQHGKRYKICIHAPAKIVEHEKWTETLLEVNKCSDGITVDLTSPVPGNVWIGLTADIKYQSSTSDIFINWETFTDVEEYKTTSHTSGILEYSIAIGILQLGKTGKNFYIKSFQLSIYLKSKSSVKGGSDIVPFTTIGLVNHIALHNLNLQNGHDYFASVKGMDFSGRSSISHSFSVRIDNTPPQQTSKPISIDGRHIHNLTEVKAWITTDFNMTNMHYVTFPSNVSMRLNIEIITGNRWKDVFYDVESGIQYYMLEVGSKPKFNDIVQPTVTKEDCEVSVNFVDTYVHEGHAYFFTIKAINKANLVTTASSWAYIYDKSPPEAGQVFDGISSRYIDNNQDIDFQTATTGIGAHWEEFYDPHTSVKVYKVAIGTCPGCDDVLQTHDVGIIYDFNLKGINLAVGIRYYTTVTACNTADLCTSSTSDGVVIDNSPPNSGKVKDGADYKDINYQSLKYYVAATWQGFNDPQSGLDKYSVRIGTVAGRNDILSDRDVPLTDIIVFPNITTEIPTKTRIYITVRAYNKAGLYSEATSNGFIVDDTPPVFIRKPTLYNEVGSIIENSIVYRSCFKVTWEVNDEESFIERQYISVTSHRGGEINTTSTELNGIVRDYTYTRLDLHDGGEYFVNVIVCNGAKICVKETSDGILLDNSPPITGTFAIHTDHAGNPDRHVPEWMMWSRFQLWLSWLGFSDLHTGIDYYMVSVGSEYMMDDLNGYGGPQKFHHQETNTSVEKRDEGKVQTFEVDTTPLEADDFVFVSIWAVNTVGLSSDTIHSQFHLIPGGSLELIRRCSSQTCLGHCICAPKDKRCPLKGDSCIDNTHNNTNTLIAVYDITYLGQGESDDIKFTASHDTLAARWRIVQIHDLLPKWYEWSVGLTDADEPEGVIDETIENIWHPCGQIDNALYTMPKGKLLNDMVSYSFFVRAWYDSNTFADFKSDGVTVMSKPLTTTNFIGVGVKEHLPGHWKNDIDVMLLGGMFSVSWHQAFINANSVISRFRVYLSTYPGGHDIHGVDIDLPGTMTAVNISRVPLLPGIWYYSNVVGYSYAGQHVTLSSDGFTVDIDKPTNGVINDGIGNSDIDFQNNSIIVSASWHGFGDSDSGISKYYWCVQFDKTDSDCDILPYQNVGIHRSVSRSINSSIINSGTKIVSKVYAVDFVGHVSDVITSNGVVIDDTPPRPVKMFLSEETKLMNPSFEESDTHFTDISTMSTADICDHSRPNYWNFSDKSCVCVLGSSKSIAMHGRSFLFVRGNVWQLVDDLEADSSYSVKFCTAYVPFDDAVVSTKEGFVEFGNERHMFLIHRKHDKYGSKIDWSWHPHTFYFTAKDKNVNITFGSVDATTGILIDNIQVFKVVILEDKTLSGRVLSNAVWLHEWLSIHASWQFIDQESPIVEYAWAIGYKEGSTEIQRYTSVGLNTFAYNYNISLAHTSQVHVTVVATNAVGLSSIATAESLLVDLTPPQIEFVYDGMGYDIDSQTTDEIIANWKVEDPESGLSHCEWAVGFRETGNDVQAFIPISPELTYVSKVFDHTLLSSRTVYVTLRCHNNAGLHSLRSTDGVTISNSPPSTKNAQLEILNLPVSEYPNKPHFQRNVTTMKFKWSGFEDFSGLDSYIVHVENKQKSVSLSRTVLYEHSGMVYCSLRGFELQDGSLLATVSAVNSAFLSSKPVTTNLTIFTKTPIITETTGVTLSEMNRTLTITWNKVFTSSSSLFYEVSVGTAFNGADIVQWQETTNEFLIMHIPLRVKISKEMSIYITITAVGMNALYSTKSVVLKL